MEYLYILLGSVLVFIGAPYVIAPILTYKNQRLPARYVFNIHDQEQFQSQREDTFNNLHNEILREGFRYVGSSLIEQKNCYTYFSIYYLEEKMIICTLLTTEAPKIPTITQIELTRLYTNGATLNVNNFSIPYIYPKWKLRETYRFQNISSFSELLAIAERIMAFRKTDNVPIQLYPGREFQVIENYLNSELNHLVEKGWASAEIVNNQRQLTLKGAIFMTWKLCWPVKWILNKIDSIKAKKVLDSA